MEGFSPLAIYHYINSHKRFNWLGIDIVGGKLMLISFKAQGVKFYIRIEN